MASQPVVRLLRLSQQLIRNTASATADFPDSAAVREDLAIAHQLPAKFGMDDLVWNHISARIRPGADEYYITPFPRLFDEVHASDITVATSGNVTGHTIHGGILAARPDVHAIRHSHTKAIVAVSCLAEGLMFLDQNSAPFYGRVGYHDWEGMSLESSEGEAIARGLGPAPNHTLIMRNHGACTVGASVGEAWVRMYYLDKICRNQLEVLKTGAPINQPSHKVLEFTRNQAEVDGFAIHGEQEWGALRRLVSDGARRSAGNRILER